MTNDGQLRTDQIQRVDCNRAAEETAVQNEAYRLSLQKGRFPRGGGELDAAKFDRSREQRVVKTRGVDHHTQLSERIPPNAFQHGGPNERQVERRVGDQQHAG